MIVFEFQKDLTEVTDTGKLGSLSCRAVFIARSISIQCLAISTLVPGDVIVIISNKSVHL